MKLQLIVLMIPGLTNCAPTISTEGSRRAIYQNESRINEMKRFLDDIRATELLYEQLYEKGKMLGNVYYDLDLTRKERLVGLLDHEEFIKATILLCMLDAAQIRESTMLRNFADNTIDTTYSEWLRQKMNELEELQTVETASQILQFISLLRCIFLIFARIVLNAIEFLYKISRTVKLFMYAYLIINLFFGKNIFTYTCKLAEMPFAKALLS